jgi:hypothetical protein
MCAVLWVCHGWGGLREFSLNHFVLTALMHEQPIDWLLNRSHAANGGRSAINILQASS